MLKFKVDENLPTEVAGLLVGVGYDAVTVGDQRMARRPDTELAAVCQREGRAVVTLDLDFADIRAFSTA
jgi:predicted nuclease of predicted toxin-antitoxin system